MKTGFTGDHDAAVVIEPAEDGEVWITMGYADDTKTPQPVEFSDRDLSWLIDLLIKVRHDRASHTDPYDC